MGTIHLQKIAVLPLDQGLLNQAVGFFNAASRCFGNVAISPIVHNSPMTPGIVCAAFSIELYLKLLHFLASGVAPRGHKLGELFDSLALKERQRIAEKYGSNDVSAHITEVSAAFMDWRYEHEHEALNINPDALMAIATACHLAAREMNPKLTVFGENSVALQVERISEA